MSFKENLDLLISKATAEIPALLVIAGLTALDEYVYGGPSDSEYKSLGFYIGPSDETPTDKRFKPVIQLQLPGISYEESLKYYHVIYDYLYYSLNVTDIKMTGMDRLSTEEFPPDQTGSTIHFFYLEFFEELDDCDL